MKTVVIGTAGHIDHGKSELVAALTGTHPDRLREERERGITIDIGFANLPLGELVLSFVDVPGHERFIKNMLAGASGIDLVLLVVAADESVRPQTREHFHICRLLGLKRGVIALTKLDLVDPELAELAGAEVRDFVRGSFLESAPIVPVSARTRAGIGALIEALRAAAAELPARAAAGPARLPVDRSFTVKGFGTVVTGTLIAGSIQTGEELEIPMDGRRVRIRGLEVHGKPVAGAQAGQRVAINLQGISHHDIGRGDLLATPGSFEPTSMFDARVSLLEEAPALLGDLERVRLHAGTAEILARVRLLSVEELAPGGEGYAQFRLERPAVLVPGDRFIFRRYSPAATLGGGVVLDAFPVKHRRAETGAAKTLALLDGAGIGERAEWVIVSSGPRGVLPRALARRAGAPLAGILGALAPALEQGRILLLGSGPDLVVSAEGFEMVRRRAEAALRAFHASQPLAPGYPLEEFRARLDARMSPEVMKPVLAELARSGTIRIEKDVAALPGHRVSLGPEVARLAGAISDLFRKAGLNPPEAGDALRELGAEGTSGAAVMAHLFRGGVLRRLRDGRIFHGEALEDLKRRLRQYRAQSETIDIATFKDLAGVSRKNAIPLLEYFDEERVTIRRGSDRVILE